MSFEEFCRQHNLTDQEREEAAYYLAFIRMKKTLKTIL
jgi:hypothetical protein